MKDTEIIGFESLASFDNSERFAKLMDKRDPLAQYRNEFLIPQHNGEPIVYMAGNSLGLQPRKAQSFIEQELKDWADMGVEGHFHARTPWMPYHESLTHSTARLVGALPHEVVVMNSLTVRSGHPSPISRIRSGRCNYRVAPT